MSRNERIFFISVISVLIVIIVLFQNSHNLEQESKNNIPNVASCDIEFREVYVAGLPEGCPIPSPSNITITDEVMYVPHYVEMDSSFRKAVQLVLNDPYFIKNQSKNMHLIFSSSLDASPPHVLYQGYFYGINATKYDIKVSFPGWGTPMVEFTKSDSEE